MERLVVEADHAEHLPNAHRTKYVALFVVTLPFPFGRWRRAIITVERLVPLVNDTGQAISARVVYMGESGGA